MDSPLEGAGFELSVPGREKGDSAFSANHTPVRRAKWPSRIPAAPLILYSGPLAAPPACGYPTDSLVEGDGFEPSVPREDCQRPVMRGQFRTRLAAGGRWIRTIGTRQIFSGARRSPRKFIFRNINRLPRASRILARADIAVRNSLMVLFQFPVTAE